MIVPNASRRRRVQGMATLLTVLAIAVLSGCASVPRAELKSYVEAFNKAKEVGIDVYATLKPAMASGQAGSAVLPKDAATAVPLKLVGTLGPGWSAPVGGCDTLRQYRDLHVRCQAFELAARYNAIVIELTKETPTVDATAEISGLLSLLGPLGALGGIVTSQLPNFGELKKILDGALRASRDDEILQSLEQGLPIIRELVVLLGEDVPLIHGIQRKFYEQELVSMVNNEIEREKGRFLILYEAIGEIKSVDAKYHEKIENRAMTATEIYASNKEYALQQIVGRMRQMRNSSEAAEVTDDEIANDKAKLEIQLAVFEEALRKFDARVAKWRAFDEALREYNKLLSELSLALGQLERAAASDSTVISSFLGLTTAGQPVSVQALLDLSFSMNARVASIRELLRSFGKEI